MDENISNKKTIIKWLSISAGVILTCLLLWWLREVIIWGLSGISILVAVGAFIFLGLALHEKFITKTPENECQRSIKDNAIILSVSLISLVLIQTIGTFLIPQSAEEKLLADNSQISKSDQKPGREVEVVVGYDANIKLSKSLILTSDLLNKTLKNVTARIEGGDIHIYFDIDSTKWPFTKNPFGGNNSYVMSGRRLLIRYAEAGGKILNFLITKERYICQWASKIQPLRPSMENNKFVWFSGFNDKGPLPIKYTPLKDKGNHLTYNIGKRDADYVAIVQVSFDTNKYDYLLTEQIGYGKRTYESFKDEKDAIREAKRIIAEAKRKKNCEKTGKPYFERKWSNGCSILGKEESEYNEAQRKKEEEARLKKQKEEAEQRELARKKKQEEHRKETEAMHAKQKLEEEKIHKEWERKRQEEIRKYDAKKAKAEAAKKKREEELKARNEKTRQLLLKNEAEERAKAKAWANQ